MKNGNLVFSAIVLVLFAASCGDDGPSGGSGPSVSVGAPGIVSPADGAQVGGQVTLTVSNASVSGGSGPARYSFQISTDSGFGALIAQASDIPEGTGGQTSWTVGSELASGEFFWRARATVGTTQGPFSTPGRILFRGDITTGGRNDRVLIYDPLTNGTTQGDRGGGQLT